MSVFFSPPSNTELRIDLKRDVELGSHSELDFIVCFRFQQLVVRTLSQFGTLFRAAVERTSC